MDNPHHHRLTDCPSPPPFNPHHRQLEIVLRPPLSCTGAPRRLGSASAGTQWRPETPAHTRQHRHVLHPDLLARFNSTNPTPSLVAKGLVLWELGRVNDAEKSFSSALAHMRTAFTKMSPLATEFSGSPPGCFCLFLHVMILTLIA